MNTLVIGAKKHKYLTIHGYLRKARANFFYAILVEYVFQKQNNKYNIYIKSNALNLIKLSREYLITTLA